MDFDLNDVNDITSSVNDLIGNTRTIARIVSNTSISRLAKDSIFQFPCITSASINTDEAYTIAKTCERNYAAMLVSAISLRSFVDLEKYGSINGYLKSFHTNGILGGTTDLASATIESTTVTSAMVDATSKVTDLGLSTLWDCVEEQVDTELINDMYQPYKRTARILQDAVDGAMEARAKVNRPSTADVTYVRDPDEYNGGVSVSARYDANGALLYPQIRVEKNGKVSYKADTSRGPLRATAPVRGSSKYGVTYVGKSKEDDILNNQTPTLVNISFQVKAKGAVTTYEQICMIGVRANVRRVNSSMMVSSLIEGIQNRFIFKFMKWTKGEIKTSQAISEFIFGFSKMKNAGVAAAKNSSWLKNLSMKKYASVYNRILGKRLLPNATIIMTDLEAAQVKSATGADFRNLAVARKFMKDYFLIGLAIYDTEGKVIDILTDGDEDFTSYSMRSLVAAVKKDTELLDSKF